MNKRIGSSIKFYQFRTKLKYKCLIRGCKFGLIDEYNTTKACSYCDFGTFSKDTIEIHNNTNKHKKYTNKSFRNYGLRIILCSSLDSGFNIILCSSIGLIVSLEQSEILKLIKQLNELLG